MKIERIEKIVNAMKDPNGNLSSQKFLDRLNSVSFWELITELEKIEIPIIQRDYAQGRKNKETTEIRNKFLESLLKVLKSENESIELDFVY